MMAPAIEEMLLSGNCYCRSLEDCECHVFFTNSVSDSESHGEGSEPEESEPEESDDEQP